MQPALHQPDMGVSGVDGRFARFIQPRPAGVPMLVVAVVAEAAVVAVVAPGYQKTVRGGGVIAAVAENHNQSLDP